MAVSLSSTVTIVLHTCGILAVVQLYTSGYGASDLVSGHCSGNETRWGRVVDYLPEPLLLLDVGLVLRWLPAAVGALYTVYVAVQLYRTLFSFIDDVYDQKGRDVGYLVSPGKTKRDVANMIRRRRQLGDLPPLYPNGWYEVMRSDELPVGAVKAVHMIGKHFAVFRGENGQVSVMDAYCPHLGGNLGAGGRVIGNCIECPFHGWQFDGQSGNCTVIPYAAKVPSFAKTKVWPSTERNDLIFVWFDAEDRDPMFELGHFQEIKKKQWTYRGRIVHYINAHIQDISENGADIAHLQTVHEAGIAAGGNLGFRASWLARIHTHHWNVKWEPLPPPQSHVGRMTLKTTNSILGWIIKPLEVNVVTDQMGPAVVCLKFRFLLGSGVWIETIVPEEPMMLRMANYVYADWWMPTFIATSILKGMGTQIERDVHVWNNKTYVSRPMLVKEDHLIQAHRRWFSQFYSEHSPRFDPKKETLEW